MRRRYWLGAGTLGAAGLAYSAYRVSPAFWQQFGRELGRPILPATAIPHPKQWPDRGVHAAWLGHSTVLLKMDGFTVLTDPVLFDRVGLRYGPLTLGLKRLTAPALQTYELPAIDLILLSHAHMDHMDTATLRSLESQRTVVVTASKTSDIFRAPRFGTVHELAWGDRVRVGPLEIRALEVNHWGARMRTDTYRGYNGYLIEPEGGRRVLFAGDTAGTDAFRAVRTSRPVDLAIFPIGTYNPWIRYHCNPEQAWRMGNDAGAERFLPVHHQTFQLSREPFLEPIERLQEAAGREERRIVLGSIGQEVSL